MICKDVIRMKKWIRICLILFFSAVFLFSAYQLTDYYIRSRQQKQQFDRLAQLVQSSTTVPPATEPAGSEPQQTEPVPQQTTAPQPLPEYGELYELNNDFAGWLQIENTRINYPVMQTPDNADYYLRRDFYGNQSAHGCLYAREQCDILKPSDNITIYGHNMNDGSMFAALMDYRSKSFFESHRFIRFDTRMEKHTYEVFAVLVTTANKVSGFPYHKFVDAQSEEEYGEFIARCKALSLYDTGVTPVYGDKLITLSTCEYTQKDGRLVVMAKLVS